MKFTPLLVLAIFFQVVLGYWVAARLAFYGNSLWQNNFLELFSETVIGIALIILLLKFKKIGIILTIGYVFYFVIRLFILPTLTGGTD